MLTVTSQATDLNLLTLEEVRTACGITDNSQDVALETLRVRVAATIAQQCRVATDGATPPTLRKETLTEVIRLNRSMRDLVLSRRPIVSVASITEDGTALDSADYEINSGAGLVMRLSSDALTYWRACKITIVYDAGWETVPVDLKLAASKLALAFNSEAGRNSNLKRVKVEGLSEREYFYGSADDPLFTEEIESLLEPFMQQWV
jgi:hypothetical protein